MSEHCPCDEIPLPSVGVLSDEEISKQLREDMCRQYIEGMKDLRDKLISANATVARQERELAEAITHRDNWKQNCADAVKSVIVARDLLDPNGSLSLKEAAEKLRREMAEAKEALAEYRDMEEVCNVCHISWSPSLVESSVCIFCIASQLKCELAEAKAEVDKWKLRLADEEDECGKYKEEASKWHVCANMLEDAMEHSQRGMTKFADAVEHYERLKKGTK